LQRFLAGVEGLIATSTTTATFLADFWFNGLIDLTPTDRAVALAAKHGLGWMFDTSQAKESAQGHWLTVGASGGRLFVRENYAAGNVRAVIVGDVLASITTMQWNGTAKARNAGAPMDDANFNRRQIIRVGASVSFAQMGMIDFDGPIELQALRRCGSAGCRRGHSAAAAIGAAGVQGQGILGSAEPGAGGCGADRC